MNRFLHTFQILLAHQYDRRGWDRVDDFVLVRHGAAYVGTALHNIIAVTVEIIGIAIRRRWFRYLLHACDDVGRIHAVWLLGVFILMEFVQHPFREISIPNMSMRYGETYRLAAWLWTLRPRLKDR